MNDFEGEKFTIDLLINQKIVITNYEKCDSTKHPGTKYYKLLFIFKDHNDLVLGFTTTGATQIVNVLNKSPKLPLYKTICKRNKTIFFKEDVLSNLLIIKNLSNLLNIDFNLL